MASGLEAHHVYTGHTNAKKPQFRLPIFPCILQKQPHSGLIFLILYMRVIKGSLCHWTLWLIHKSVILKPLKDRLQLRRLSLFFFISFTIFPQIFIGFGQWNLVSMWWIWCYLTKQWSLHLQWHVYYHKLLCKYKVFTYIKSI